MGEGVCFTAAKAQLFFWDTPGFLIMIPGDGLEVRDLSLSAVRSSSMVLVWDTAFVLHFYSKPHFYLFIHLRNKQA
jgi:hypothetical protein